MWDRDADFFLRSRPDVANFQYRDQAKGQVSCQQRGRRILEVGIRDDHRNGHGDLSVSLVNWGPDVIPAKGLRPAPNTCGSANHQLPCNF